MEFDIVLKDQSDPHSPEFKAKVKYGTTIRAALITYGLNYLNPYNQYGRPVPACLPLRGPAVFILKE